MGLLGVHSLVDTGALGKNSQHSLSGIEGLINEPENISIGCQQQQVALGSPATDVGWLPRVLGLGRGLF